MVKKSMTFAGAAIAVASLSSCANFFLPDSNHPDVLPPPMYRAHPVPTGASWVTDHYHKHDDESVKPYVGTGSGNLAKDPSRRR